MAKQTGKKAGTTRRHSSRVYQVGQAVMVATQYDGTIPCEIQSIEGHVFIVRSRAGKTYRILVTEII